MNDLEKILSFASLVSSMNSSDSVDVVLEICKANGNSLEEVYFTCLQTKYPYTIDLLERYATPEEEKKMHQYRISINTTTELISDYINNFGRDDYVNKYEKMKVI